MTEMMLSQDNVKPETALLAQKMLLEEALQLVPFSNFTFPYFI